MRFVRRYRFVVLLFALLIVCGVMAARQYLANQAKHVEMREAFILLYSKGYRPEAERLYNRLMLDLEDLSDKSLMEDYQRTLMLVDPLAQQRDNPVWRYHWTLSNELEKRSVGALKRALKLAGQK
jgi:hypothetical protein